ncbi:amidase domain-containing protein [Salipaludibacillus keqinensis]|nr:amidase domain-containing protein [Salipaludibacillus keqinensis]
MTDQLNELKSYWLANGEGYLVESVYEGECSVFIREEDINAFHRKVEELDHREAKVVKNNVEVLIINHEQFSSRSTLNYMIMIEQLIKQRTKVYLETQYQRRKAVFEHGKLIDDYLIDPDGRYDKLGMNEVDLDSDLMNKVNNDVTSERINYYYDRMSTVKYAERWWDDYNPDYKRFDNDCTNFISQCLRAGGAPMQGASNRKQGWWYKGHQWSFSWSVAHSLRWFLSGSRKGLRAREVSSAENLMRGDVICYDFNGDGRWQHTTVVVDKDANHMPLVNAHTTNSRMRYWTYEDSSAWTPDIKYKFFHIIDGTSDE